MKHKGSYAALYRQTMCVTLRLESPLAAVRS